MAKTDWKITDKFRKELMEGLKQWMGMESMIGDYVVHFIDGARAYGWIEDPRGPRFIHLFVQDEENNRKFDYRNAPVYDSEVLNVEVLDKDAVIQKSKKVEMVTMEQVLEAIDFEESDEAFFDKLNFDQCPDCGEYHIAKGEEDGNARES